MYFNIDQKILSMATSVLILVCLFVPVLFKKELKGSEEKYYLIAFYISAIIHFFTVVSPESKSLHLLDLSKSLSVINGALLPFWISAFVCKRERKEIFFQILIGIAILNLVSQFMHQSSVYLSVFFAFASNLIGCVVVLKSIKNKADWGLAACFVVFLMALLVVLIEAPHSITPVAFYLSFYSWLLIFIPGFICGATIFIFLRYVIELLDEISVLAHKDPLSGAANRRFAFELINKQIPYIKRKGSEACVIMADLDHFKQVNDTYGHQAGDVTIKLFTDIIMSQVREYDVVCRYGGEEFLLFLPETDVLGAKKIAERIRIQLNNTSVKSDEHVFKVSSSFGVSGGLPELSLDDAIKAADMALYTAKKNGRNQTEIFTQKIETIDESGIHPV